MSQETYRYKTDKYNKGFCPEKERKFLGRLDVNLRRINLDLELTTQLSEDFGLVEYSKSYVLKEGKIADSLSGQSVVELTSRGGIEEETRAMTMIESGLKDNPEKIYVHLSPKNDDLGYTMNCVDFWRKESGKVIWNRIVVESSFEDMKRIMELLGDKKEVVNEMEMLGRPVESDLKLCELFSLFRLAKKKSEVDLRLVEKTVKEISDEFEIKFGRKMVEDEGLILRLYSAAYDYLSAKRLSGEGLISRRSRRDEDYFDLKRYMYAPMMKMRKEASYGCAGETMIAGFGYYVDGGKVVYGSVPEGFKLCKKCGCWYSGEKCALCT